MTLSLVSTSIQTALVDNPRCGRRNQATRTTSHVLCDCEALNTLRFGHLVQHFIKSSNSEDICQKDTALCSRCGAAACMSKRAAQNTDVTVTVYRSPQCPPFCVLLSYQLIGKCSHHQTTWHEINENEPAYVPIDFCSYLPYTHSCLNPSVWNDECCSHSVNITSWRDEHCSPCYTLSLIRLYLQNILRNVIGLLCPCSRRSWLSYGVSANYYKLLLHFFLSSRILGFFCGL
jgi:hypothetical protein